MAQLRGLILVMVSLGCVPVIGCIFVPLSLQPPGEEIPKEEKQPVRAARAETQDEEQPSPYHPVSTSRTVSLQPPLKSVSVPTVNLIPPPSDEEESDQGAEAHPSARAVRIPDQDPVLIEVVRHYLKGRGAEAAAAMRKLPEEAQELLPILLPIIARSSKNAIRDMSPREISVVVNQLQQLTATLRPRAELTIGKITFCSEIRGFGDYEPIPGVASYETGTDDRPGELVRAYVELANFTTTRRKDELKGDFYETTLALRFQIESSEGKVVWSQEHMVGPERNRSARRDLFLNCYFHVPPGLAVGHYTLTLRVSDVTELTPKKDGSYPQEIPAHRRAEKSLDFKVEPRG